jgi:membrane-associated phospholipid phosphatase
MLRAILLEVTAVVAMFCVVGAVTLVGPSRLAALRTELRPRLRESAPYLAVLIVVLILNSITRDSAQSLSWQIGYEITYLLAEYDTGVVATIQSFESQALTTYFSSVYVYGYVFVLVFPVLAYVALSDRKHFQRLVVAYSINYFVGLTLYILFVAYGPRNWYGIEVGAEAAKVVYENQLYGLTGEDTVNELLTSEVNSRTNVFPSLHTSLSATVAIFAYRTRETYRAWFGIATVLAVSIIISTMYLGIHWAVDILFGLGLAGLSVYVAERYVD